MLANEIYRGCSVTVWKADVNGIKTAVKATLYDPPRARNSPIHRSWTARKFKEPVYIADPVVLGIRTPRYAHYGDDFPPGTWRGNWATAIPGDYFRDGAAGTNTQNVYVVQNYHTSGVWATDVADSTKMALVIDYVTLTGTVVPDATTSLKGKVELATNAENDHGYGYGPSRHT